MPLRASFQPYVIWRATTRRLTNTFYSVRKRRGSLEKPGQQPRADFAIRTRLVCSALCRPEACLALWLLGHVLRSDPEDAGAPTHAVAFGQ